MAFGLRLSFLRDISPHFCRKNSDNATQMIEGGDVWFVLGSSDYLVVETLENLSDVNPAAYSEESEEIEEPSGTTIPKKHPANPGGRLDLNLFPSSSSEFSADKCIFTTVSPARPSHVFIIKLAVSSVALDQCKGFATVLDLMRSLEEKAMKLGASLGLNQIESFYTLGGIDVVLLLPIDLPTQAKIAMGFVQQLRELRICEISRDPSQVDFHVLSSASANLVGRSLDVDGNDSLNLLTRVSFAAGHEARALEAKEDSKEIYVSWGERAVVQHFDSLNKMLTSREKVFFEKGKDGQRSKRRDVDSSRTEILFRPEDLLGEDAPALFDQASYRHGEVQLSGESEVEISKLEGSILRFCTDHLGRTQGGELLKVFETLRHSLLRSERVGGIRDLLPFFRQLGACLHLVDEWDLYLRKGRNALEDTSNSLTYLTNHLWRAIRNRIESRVENLDPSFPGTLDNGASKLVNAYSIVALICWEMFSTDDGEKRQVAYEINVAQRFAASVCSGSAGRVECQEAFAYFREFYEQYDGKPISSKQVGWCSPLLMLNISGPVLYRPEAAFVHCMHEMAEFANWSQRSATDQLRPLLNEHILAELQGLFILLVEHAEAVFESSEKTLGSNDLRYHKSNREAYMRALPRILRAALCVLYLGHADGIDLETAIARCRQEIDPVKLPDIFKRACAMLASDRFRRKSLLLADIKDSALSSSICLDISTILRDGLEQKDNSPLPSHLMDVMRFFEITDDYSEFLHESIADFGMMLAIDQLRGQRDSIKYEFVEDVNYCFARLSESLFSWLPAKETARLAFQRILGRWAVMHECFSAVQDYSEWTQKFNKDVHRYLRAALPKETAVRATEDLDSRIADALGYFGDISVIPTVNHSKCLASTFNSFWQKRITTVFLPPKDSQPRELLERMFITWHAAVSHMNKTQAPNSPDSHEIDALRKELVLSLWAHSQKLSANKMFEVLPA